MKLLNVGCGGQRPQPGIWWNLDTLRTQLAIGTPERINLDREPNYIECNLLTQSIPFPTEHFDGILLQHVLEHFTCHDAVDVLLRCRAVLKPGGLLCASVPEVHYFMQVHDNDTPENAVKLFGEPISEPEHKSFSSYALWHKDHKQITTIHTLTAMLVRAGFAMNRLFGVSSNGGEVMDAVSVQLNRLPFSAILCAYK